ncbi:MAG TPA: asparaginase [Anaerolineaceae bacterium]|nr:asparaginase [Anaerolineaceae bacterium]
MKKIKGYAPLIALTRGGLVECLHFGALAVVDSAGTLLASLADPKLITYPRSSMKPFQVLPFVERGGPDFYNLTEEELAIMCASHAGTDRHVEVLKSIHEKVGLHEGNLQCGTHWPEKETADAMKLRGEEPTPFRHNCSGKHTGMLAAAKMRNLSLNDYLEPEHPVQKSIRKAMAEMSGTLAKELLPGTDGCSAPVYALQLCNFASAVARLCDPDNLGTEREDACRKITSAMIHYPFMIAGPHRLDTALMEVMQGKVISKGGAEGYQMIGIMPGALHPRSRGIGIAFKFSDGDPNRRATHCLTVALMKAFGFEKEMESEAFKEFSDPVLRNWRGLEVGEIRPVHKIQVRWN